MKDFDETVARFKNQELDVDDWNFVVHYEGAGDYAAYIMGEGSQQCLAYKTGFASKEVVIEFFKSLGVSRVLEGLG
jgi:hypothetical protein